MGLIHDHVKSLVIQDPTIPTLNISLYAKEKMLNISIYAKEKKKKTINMNCRMKDINGFFSPCLNDVCT